MVLYLLFLPLLGSILTLFSGYIYRFIALFFALATLFLASYIAFNFSCSAETPQFLWNCSFIRLGIDGISLPLIILTSLLSSIVILVSWNLSKVNLSLFLLMTSLTIGTFAALDIFLFYIFFEASLIPMFYLIGIWGSKEKVYAAFKFFLFTLTGSITFLLAILYIYYSTATTSILDLPLRIVHLSWEEQKWLWIAFFITFAVKIPMIPVHTWLPDAHVQAPTGGSILLAGILIKIGAYGFLRLSLPFFPLISIYFAPYVIILSLIAVIYTSLIALNQTDIKKLIAYSSIAHMGFTTAGIFSLNTQGIEGGIFQMLSHGVISAALFLAIGILYDRKHTREMEAYSGLAHSMPLFSTLFFILTLGAIGLPGTSGFIGEFLAVLGVFQNSVIYSFILSLGIILGAWYMLVLNKNIIWGTGEEILKDLSHRELIAILPLVILEVILGIFPNIILRVLHIPVARIIGSF